MNYKRLGCIAVLLMVLIFPASASLVSFLVLETGLNEGASGTQYGTIWEEALMSSFFNAGHIVTNSPILRMEQKPAQDLTGQVKADFDEAALSGAEYYVLGFLYYEIRGRAAAPVDIALKTYKTNTGELVFEQNFPVGIGRNPREEYQFAQNAALVIISQLKDR